MKTVLSLPLLAVVISLIQGLSCLAADAPIQPYASYWHPDTLLDWNPETDPDAPFNRASVPLLPRFVNSDLNLNRNARVNEGGVTFITTFALTSGNPSQGAMVGHYNAITMWQYIDLLIFWGGSAGEGLILAPNPTVIDAAHRNGVPVLGTVFFPPNVYGGRIEWVNDFLLNGRGMFPVADKLIEVARYYGFDGWFINQETAGGNAATAEEMRDFIQYFREQAPELHIQWYDAMRDDGAIAWQNAFTSRNKMFMWDNNEPISHSMFLNFWWSASALVDSRNRALSLRLDPHDLYAGIDIESSGLGQGARLDAIFPSGQPHRLSVGFYGGQWIFTHSSSPADFANREIRFWSGANADPSNTATDDSWKGIAHYIPANSAVSSKPFATSFNRGQGNRYVIDGDTLMTRSWNNLSLQDVLPTWRWDVSSTGQELTPSLDLNDAYYGGTSLRFTGSLSAMNDVKLYQTKLPVTADTKLQLIYKRGSTGAPSGMEVAISFEENPSDFAYLPVGTTSTAGWETVEFDLAEHAGKTIAVIGLRFAHRPTISNYEVRIGRLAVFDGTAAPPAPPSDLQVLRSESVDLDTLSLRLQWDHSPDEIRVYNVYVRHPDNSRTWVGATPNNAYFVPFARRQSDSESLNIEVEAVGPLFVASTEVATILVEFPPAPNMNNELRGFTIGTDGSYNNNPDKTKITVFDGDPDTFFDAAAGSGAWVGKDFGGRQQWALTAIRYLPRKDWAHRMVGGVFQGSHTSDFADPVTLATVIVEPDDSVFTTVPISTTETFRYVRYLSADNGHCNVAEIEFYGVTRPRAPTGLTGGMRQGSVSLSWNSTSDATSYNVKRATISGGAYATIASDVQETVFTESGLDPVGIYYYVVTAENQAGESHASREVILSDSFAQWLVGQGMTPGEAGTGFAEDFDGNGRPNGIEYAIPDGLGIVVDSPDSVVSAEVRDDAGLTFRFWISEDLTVWREELFPPAVDQSGVGTGFVRRTFEEPIDEADTRQFFRLEVDRD